MTIQELKKELGLSNKDIAGFFGLTPAAYANSSAKIRYENALCSFYKFLKREGEKNNKITTMKTYTLIITKSGERKGTEISHFYGESETDSKMLKEVESYLRLWLDGYNNSLSTDEINDLFSDFDGSFSYDVWSFNLGENGN